MTLKSGIYKIESLSNPYRIYIGSAVDINKRWITHLWSLRRNKHHSQKLQRHYNKYGELDFKFIDILRCKPEELLNIEQYLLDFYKPYFNNCKIAGSSLGIRHSEEFRQKCRNRAGEKRKPRSPETRFKIGETRRERNIVPWNYNKKGVYSKECVEVIASKRRKPILQYDEQNNFIREWDSAKTAGDKLGISSGNITQVAKCKKRSANGFIFKYKVA